MKKSSLAKEEYQEYQLREEEREQVRWCSLAKGAPKSFTGRRETRVKHVDAVASVGGG